MNICVFTGNLGKEPDLAVTATGTPVVKFTMAVREWSKEKPDGTLWLNIVCWEKLAETAEKFLHKGDKVTVHGRLTQRPYTDRNGIDRVWTEIVAREIELPAKAHSPNNQGEGYRAEDWIPEDAK